MSDTIPTVDADGHDVFEVKGEASPGVVEQTPTPPAVASEAGTSHVEHIVRIARDVALSLVIENVLAILDEYDEKCRNLGSLGLGDVRQMKSRIAAIG